MLLAQTFHHRRAGHVKHDDVELGEPLLCVQQALAGEGGFGRRRFQVGGKGRVNFLYSRGRCTTILRDDSREDDGDPVSLWHLLQAPVRLG
jgi:hypothetical protein